VLETDLSDEQTDGDFLLSISAEHEPDCGGHSGIHSIKADHWQKSVW
jgi:hypothetical protein